MRTSVLFAASGGSAATMLLAVAATGGLAALTDDDLPLASTATDPAPAPTAPAAAPVVAVELPQKPLVLPTGAPACGNVMTKYAAPAALSPCATRQTRILPTATKPPR
jgi:hypothetical protein